MKYARWLKSFHISCDYAPVEELSEVFLNQGQLNIEVSRKIMPLETLALPITWALRKDKRYLQPAINKCSISIQDINRQKLVVGQPVRQEPYSLHFLDCMAPQVLLAFSETNETLGNLAIDLTTKLLEAVKAAPRDVRDFPFDIFEREIEKYMDSNFSFTTEVRSSPIEGTRLRFKFLIHASCEKTTSTVVVLNGRQELYQREIQTFSGGLYENARDFSHVLIENEQVEFTNYSPQESVFINYDEFPEAVRALLPKTSAPK